MTKTAEQVIARAHRRIRVLAQDEPATQEMQVTGTEVLEGLYARLQTQATIAWALSAVPDDAYLALSDYLAAHLAGEYNRPSPVTENAAFLKLMEVIRPSDAEDRRDTDEDGLISEAEEAAGDRATYY